MSQSQAFGNYPKRKYLASPKKSYFSPKGKRKSTTNTSPFRAVARRNYKVNPQSILNYFSPTSESKRSKLTPEANHCYVDRAKFSRTPSKESTRRVLFDSKDEEDNEILIVPDDDDDENFILHIESKKKFEITNQSSGSEGCGSEKEVAFASRCLELLDQIENENNIKSNEVVVKDNVGIGHLQDDEKSTTKRATKTPTKIKDNLEIVLEEQLEISPTKSVMSIDDAVSLVGDVHWSDESDLDEKSTTKRATKTPFKTPTKIKDNLEIVLEEQLEISPTKSVMSIDDAVSLVGDVHWSDESDFDEIINVSTSSSIHDVSEKKNSNSPSEIPTPSSDTCNTEACKSETVRIDGTSSNFQKSKANESESGDINSNSSGNENVKTASFERNGGDYNDKLHHDQIGNDPLYYILTTPPASIAWNTIFQHSQYQNIHRKYFSLADEEKYLYSRLFQRKYDWLRFDNIKYHFIADLNISLNNLAALGFVKFLNPELEDLSVVLNLMQLDELKKACEIVKVNKKGKKSDMIENILKGVRSQRTLQFGNVPPANRMRQQVMHIVPKFVKLEDGPRSLFMSFLLISTYAQFKGRDDNRMEVVIDILYKLSKREKRELGLPLSATPLFSSLAKFREYEESVYLVDQLLEAKKERKWDAAKELVLRAKTELTVYLGNMENISELNDIPVHMRKYTPGSNYIYAINEGIDVLKKDKSVAGTAETVECLVGLLSQEYFQRGRRASWHCELALMFERWKKFDEIFITLKQGLEEAGLTPLGKLLLVERCEMLIKRKHGLSVPQKDELSILSEMQPYRVSTNTISATAMPNVTTNKKQMWTIVTKNGRTYMGVEEVVRQHYMSSEGGSYSEGYHDEGRIIVNLATCVFWDVIYIPLDGMFHVRLQDRPLDWGSSAFYNNRSELIEKQIEHFKETGIAGIMDVISQVCTKYYGTLSVVSWELIKLEQLPEIGKFLKCVGVEPFLKFCDYLLHSYKERSSGLPDLTLWNTNKTKCLFVEVKGPSDKLSIKQKVWLQKLNEFGIEAEVCHVHTLHTGKRDISNESD